jgi:hypothetical protein
MLSYSAMSSQESKADSLIEAATEMAESLLIQEIDTNYISSYTNRLSLRLLAINKYNNIRFFDNSINNSIRYRPDLGVNLGVGIVYKWFSLDIAANMGLDEDQIASSKYRDYQARVMTYNHYLRARYQYYYGYKIDNLSNEDLNLNDLQEIRTDIRTIQIGLQYLYVFNYGEFSLKSSFVMSERQKRSAGSLLAGGGFHMYIMDADSSVIPRNTELFSDTRSYFTQMNIGALFASFGYIYTISLGEHFFITVSLIPGLGVKSGDYRIDKLVPIESSFMFRTKTMNAFGYNSRRFFLGLQLVANHIYMPLESDLKCSILEGRISMYVGYRFKM